MSAEVRIPTFEDRTAMWASLDFPEHVWAHPAIDSYVDSLRGRYGNGTVLFRSFEIPQHWVLDFYLTRKWHDSWFFEKFWSAPTPSQFFRPADASLNYFAEHGSLTVFQESTPFHLAGDLASMHFTGGAYARSKGFGIRSKQLGDAAAQEMLADDLENSRCFTSNIPWSDFFMDLAWDHTKVVLLTERRVIHCLLATDTD